MVNVFVPFSRLLYVMFNPFRGMCMFCVISPDGRVIFTYPSMLLFLSSFSSTCMVVLRIVSLSIVVVIVVLLWIISVVVFVCAG